MKTMVYMLMLVITLSSCSFRFRKAVRYGEYYPAKFKSINNEKVFNSAYPVVWAKVLEYFAVRGIYLKVIDKENGRIISEQSNWNLANKELPQLNKVRLGYKDYTDCGSTDTTADVTAIVAAPDIVYTVIVHPIAAQETAVSIAANFDTNVYYADSLRFVRPINTICTVCSYRCFNTGKLEQEFFDEISK